MLSNGDVAISGGQYRFEICIYRHDLNRKPSSTSSHATGRDREKLKLVDSIDTGGMQVLQMLELNDEYHHFVYLLVIGHMCEMRLYKREADSFEQSGE